MDHILAGQVFSPVSETRPYSQCLTLTYIPYLSQCVNLFVTLDKVTL